MIPPERMPRTAAALADILRQQITAGLLPPRGRVPSERELMQRYGLGRDAVRRAIDELENEGLIVVRHGQASEVADFREKQDLWIDAEWQVESRMPLPEERERMGIPKGVPVFHVIYPDQTGDLYPAHLYRIRVRREGTPSE